MVGLVVSAIACLRAYIVARHQLGLEAAVLKRKQPRHSLRKLDRLFWVALRSFWSGWAGTLVIVKADTVSPGTAPDSGCFGGCAPGHVVVRH